MNTLTQPATNYSLHDKWGKALDMGFVVIPNALLRCQYSLAIGDGELVVLMNLMMSWWKVGENPFPRAETMAKRMGVSDRTVQRHLGRLEKKGLIKRIRKPDRRNEHQAAVEYDLGGIVEKLKDSDSMKSRPSSQRKVSQINEETH